MTYALVQNSTVVEYPVFSGQIKARYPNTSFTDPFEAPDEYVLVEPTPPPTTDATAAVVEDTPVFSDGKVVQAWKVVPLPAETLQEREHNQANIIRGERNSRLNTSDWTQLPDAPVDATEWATYRQELRDITSQTGFPWEVVWPTEP